MNRRGRKTSSGGHFQHLLQAVLLWHGGTINNRRAASPLVWFVKWEEREGREDVKDDRRSGRQQTSTALKPLKRLMRCYVGTSLSNDGENTNRIVWPHPPYCPDFISWEFRIFPKLARHFPCRRFESADEEKMHRRLN
ncbi:hypothetical protein TNCV_2354241 [Trichonephila clavipes]|nr:hypothetical protein TNCV_2354241 [Trichonephila clavipes]